LTFEIVYYVLSPDYNVYMDVQQAINVGIKETFEQAGIEFAYPTQLLYLSQIPGAGPQASDVGERSARK
jgi:small-conductance mechanosensitive channel